MGDAPFGHDAEFRGLFAEEAEGRLDVLAGSLLELERAKDHAAIVAALLREAHSVKGAAAMVGLPEISAVAHALEDLLLPHRDNGGSVSAAVVDVALAAVDGLRSAIRAAGAGEEHAAICSALVDDLTTAVLRDAVEHSRDATPPPSTPPASGSGDGPTLPAATPGRTASTPLREATTVAVPVARLDHLVRLAAESASAMLRTGGVVSAASGRDPLSVPEYRDLSRTLTELQEVTMRARMVPVATIAQPLQRAVRDLARSLGKEVRWEIEGSDTEMDRGVLEQLADPLLHLVRNAVDHGIEPPAEREAAGKPREATVSMRARHVGSDVIVSIADDGRGIDVGRVRAAAGSRATDAEALSLIFQPGLSTAETTTDISGRGVGLDVVQSRLLAVRGRIDVDNHPGHGCEFRIAVPITLAVLPCLIVGSGGASYAIPMHAVHSAVALDSADAVQRAGGRELIRIGGRAVAVVRLDDVLGQPRDPRGPRRRAIVLTLGDRVEAIEVDELRGQRDVVLKGLSRLLPQLEVVAGAGVEPDGSVLVVLEPSNLLDRASGQLVATASAAAGPADAASTRPAAAPRKSVLVVDDTLAVRALQRTILEKAGYEVRAAPDGVAALALLAERPSDIVLTDLDMPRLDGFDLTRTIRAHPTLRHTAVLILTSRQSEDDRRLSLEAGADGFIVKSSFDRDALLEAVERLVGAA